VGRHSRLFKVNFGLIIQKKEKKYQDSWGFPSKTWFRNQDMCGRSEKSPVEALVL